MTQETQPTLDLGEGFPPEAVQPFPWPMATDETAQPGTSHGLVLAQTWPGLTVAERGVALFVGDGAGGPGTEDRLAARLGITRDELDDLLWGLLRKGYLGAVAAWWSR